MVDGSRDDLAQELNKHKGWNGVLEIERESEREREGDRERERERDRERERERERQREAFRVVHPNLMYTHIE